MNSFIKQNIRFSLFFFFLLFLSGRIGLFLYEFAGHAFSWRLIGGRMPGRERTVVVENELEQKYRQFPIEIPLGIATAAAFIAGFFFPGRRDYTEPDPLLWKDIGLLGGFAVSAVALILIVNRM